MGTYVIKTPDIGEGIAEVELVAWHVKEGDTVLADQVLADVMTDKATVEIPSPVAGRVLALGASVGQAVAVGSDLIRLEVAGQGNVKPGAAPARAPSAAPAASAPVPPSEPVPGPALKATAPDPSHLLPAFARPPAPGAGERVQQLIDAASAQDADRAAGGRPIASPAVRRRAWELGIPLELVRPTGPAGRIVHADLDAFARAHRNLAPPGALGPAAERSPVREAPAAPVRTVVTVPVRV